MPGARACAWRRSTSSMRAISTSCAARSTAQRRGWRRPITRRTCASAAATDVGRRAVANGLVPAVIEADIDFHLFIYEASGNPLIGETAHPHWQHLRRVMAAALSEADLRVSVWDEHEGILRALEAGQTAEAEELCRGHAEQMADVLTGRLKVVISRAA